MAFSSKLAAIYFDARRAMFLSGPKCVSDVSSSDGYLLLHHCDVGDVPVPGIGVGSQQRQRLFATGLLYVVCPDFEQIGLQLLRETQNDMSR